MAQPVVIQDTISIAANSVNNNVIASNSALKSLQRLPFAAQITIAFVQSATGLQMDFDIGSENVVSSSNGRVSTGAPEIPFDVVNDGAFGMEGDMLTLKAANTTGGAISLRYMIIAEAVAEPGQAVEMPPNKRIIQQGPTSIADGTVAYQLMNGLRYERAPKDSIVAFLMTSSAAGMTREVYIDMDRIAPPSTISLANRIPQDPTDSTVSGIQVPKDSEIQLQVTNQSGGALSVFWKMIMQDLYR